MKSMYVYMLQCADDTYYTGVTNNIERRLNEHEYGIDRSSYTFERRPVTLVFYETFNDPLDAIAFEKQLKKWSRKKKQTLINGEYYKLIFLSKKTFRMGLDTQPQKTCGCTRPDKKG
jgi:putative endonuclease